jgi:hypothetical protein
MFATPLDDLAVSRPRFLRIKRFKLPQERDGMRGPGNGTGPFEKDHRLPDFEPNSTDEMTERL